ncbi:NUDIX domain-containing protein [Ilyomonas limi]|uniref:NUDIX domain-containing protein n=1 Tax=Ilyomonas limi TaxID=2575867 RepID=A0A4V5UUY2_9BACT|nr:NUDIX domain-containing protein [Ilyomonas limi]TKK70863.1 NUDIX domain-containing protein [Ilyomonas limi]
MAKKSAGLLVYHYFNEVLKVLLVHPGGPFFIKKDAGVWSIPKGEYEDGEDPLTVAKRELEEETGNVVMNDNFIALTPVKIKSGKVISVWAAASYFEQPFISSNLFSMEWPPKSGRQQLFYETDNAAYFTIEEASEKMNTGQLPFLAELVKKLEVKD